jgi:hypothetical protein
MRHSPFSTAVPEVAGVTKGGRRFSTELRPIVPNMWLQQMPTTNRWNNRWWIVEDSPISSSPKHSPESALSPDGDSPFGRHDGDDATAALDVAFSRSIARDPLSPRLIQRAFSTNLKRRFAAEIAGLAPSVASFKDDETISVASFSGDILRPAPLVGCIKPAIYTPNDVAGVHLREVSLPPLRYQQAKRRPETGGEGLPYGGDALCRPWAVSF